MSTPETNPYRPGTATMESDAAPAAASVPRKMRWRLVPTVLCYIVGIGFIGITVAGLVVEIYRAFQPSEYPGNDNQFQLIGVVLIASAAIMGALTLIAGRLFWKRRYLPAVVLCLISTTVYFVTPYILSFIASIDPTKFA